MEKRFLLKFLVHCYYFRVAMVFLMLSISAVHKWASFLKSFGTMVFSCTLLLFVTLSKVAFALP